MKVLFIGLATAIGLMNCSKSDGPSVQSAKLIIGETYVGQLEEQEVKLTLLGISDSRCPENVWCVWAGEAFVGVRVQIGPSISDSLCLCLDCTLTKGCDRTKLYSLKGREISISLSGVKPYPNTENDTSEVKTAIFELRAGQ